MSTTIFYFSGTGNSYMLARDLAAALGDARLISIPRAMRDPAPTFADECVGFVYPVYFLSMPLIVRDFIRKLPAAWLSQVKYLFAAATYGNMPGNALPDLAQLIREQGVALAAGFQLKLPENYTIAFSAPSAARQEKLFQMEKRKVAAIAAAIQGRQRTGIAKAPLEPLLKMILPLYRRLVKMTTESQRTATIHEGARFFRVVETESRRCTGCGICAAICPVNNIEMSNGGPQWSEECQQCLACLNWCPQRVIEFGARTIRHRRYTNPTVTFKEMKEGAGTRSGNIPN